MSSRPPIESGPIAWCLHCERAYQKGEYRIVSGLEMCPYPDCDGDAVFDQWNWGDVQRNNPGYPEIPERGTIYPLHGPDYVHPSKKRP